MNRVENRCWLRFYSMWTLETLVRVDLTVSLYDQHTRVDLLYVQHEAKSATRGVEARQPNVFNFGRKCELFVGWHVWGACLGWGTPSSFSRLGFFIMKETTKKNETKIKNQKELN